MFVLGVTGNLSPGLNGVFDPAGTERVAKFVCTGAAGLTVTHTCTIFRVHTLLLTKKSRTFPGPP